MIKKDVDIERNKYKKIMIQLGGQRIFVRKKMRELIN